MWRKICPKCGGDSYSSYDWGKWICPYCGEDLRLVKSEPAGKKWEG